LENLFYPTLHSFFLQAQFLPQPKRQHSSPTSFSAQRGPPPSPRARPLTGGTLLSTRPLRQPTEPGSSSGQTPTRVRTAPSRARGPARQGRPRRLFKAPPYPSPPYPALHAP
jgi:hypothetical protein